MASSISTAHRVRYANGYLELGMKREAAVELASIVPEDRSQPLVLEACIDLHSANGKWLQAALAARHLTEIKPEEPKGWISLAFAVRRQDDVAAAEKILLEAERHIGATCALMHYNLACYRCVQGDLEGAWERLAHALKMDSGWKEFAREDPDLIALHGKISALP